MSKATICTPSFAEKYLYTFFNLTLEPCIVIFLKLKAFKCEVFFGFSTPV